MSFGLLDHQGNGTKSGFPFPPALQDRAVSKQQAPEDCRTRGNPLRYATFLRKGRHSFGIGLPDHKGICATNTRARGNVQIVFASVQPSPTARASPEASLQVRPTLHWTRSGPMEELRPPRLRRRAVRQTGSAQPARRIAKPCDPGVAFLLHSLSQARDSTTVALLCVIAFGSVPLALSALSTANAEGSPGAFARSELSGQSLAPPTKREPIAARRIQWAEFAWI